MNKMVMFGALALAATTQATDLSLTSTDDSVTWDMSTPLWMPVGGGVAQVYSDAACDTAIIGSGFTGSQVAIGGYVGPKELRFDNAQDITLKNDSVNGHGLNGKLGVVNKYGTGTLVLDFASWKNYESCDWHIYGGTLRAGRPTGYGNAAANNRFCADSAIASVMIYVYDGTSLWSPAANFFGPREIDYEDAVPNVTVYTNGTLIVGNDSAYAYSFASYRDIILDGGNLDLARRGSWGTGSFKVTHKIAFKGKTPYTLSMGGQDQKLILAASRQTEFCVDDITGDASADVTLASSFDMGPNTHDRPVGLKKTGAGTLRVESRLYNAESSSARGPLGVNGTITIEEGTIDFANANNTMEGDLVVSGGSLTIRDIKDDADKTNTYYGNLTKADREIVACDTGKILLPSRYTLQSYPGIEGGAPACSSWFVAREGGTIEVGTATGTSLCYFGNLWLDGGDLVYAGNGEWPQGVGGVLGTMKFSGKKAYVLKQNAAVETKYQQLLVNNNSQTTFDVSDITGDDEPDVTFEIPLVLRTFQIDGQWTPAKNVGYIKRGAGTMRLNYSNSGNGTAGVSPIDGTITVEAGTLQVDNGCQSASVAVSSGAFVSGTSSVKDLALSAGAGFRAKNEQANGLTVSGDVSIGVNGVVDIAVDTQAPNLKASATVAKFSGAISGNTNLEGWTVRVNGKDVKGRVYLEGNVLKAKEFKGFLLIFR